MHLPDVYILTRRTGVLCCTSLSSLPVVLAQASTFDGVLEFRNEHFWTVSPGQVGGEMP